MRSCATCAELEKLLETTADDHWDLVLRTSNESDPEKVKALKPQVWAAKVTTDETLARYKEHLATAHSQTR